MSASQKSDHALMKQTNHGLVLQFIQGHGPISRKAIAQISGLSTASVSKMTGELIERGLVQEVGEADGEGRVGRREVLLQLNAQAGFVVGVMFGIQAIICVLTDLDARVLHAIETPLPVAEQASPADARFTPDTIIQTTILSIEDLLALAQIDRARLLGIGVAINGIVDPDTGVSRVAPHFGWRNVNVSAPLAAHFGISVLLENDGRALTIAEQWFGNGRSIDNFVTVVAGQGIGAGVIANGQIYRGATSGAGEFGHIIFQPDGPRCSCGKQGCLEALAAEPAILRQVDEALAAGAPSALAGVQPLKFEAVARAADAGDELARRVLSNAGRWLGIGIASLVNILNPQLLIIKGETVCAGRWYFEAMEIALREHVFDGLADSLRILTEPDETYTWARGAACVLLSALFALPLHRQEPEHINGVRALAFPERNP
jgi:predicted NBD/HSP70 family sugar kinase